MNAKSCIGKTISEITDGTNYCIIEFTDGSRMEVSYSQFGYYGSLCTLDYYFEDPKEE